MNKEFSFIDGLRHLTIDKDFPNARNLEDDIAIISKSDDGYLIATKDLITEGTHFFSDDPIEKIIKKAIRVNISDIAAKGAKPYGMFFGICLPDLSDQNIIQKALSEDLSKYNIPLLGGDTIKSDKITISVTMLGLCKQPPPLRSGAKIGDDIYVTGILGHSDAGLKIRLGELESDNNDLFLEKYLLPDPPVNMGVELLPFMNSSCDISDGLIADLSHILKASKCGADLQMDKIPFVNAYGDKEKDLKLALYGGDDYEILFTSNAKYSDIMEMSKKNNRPITKIGRVIDGYGINNIEIMSDIVFSHFV